MKNILITGATGGLGQEFAKHYATSGNTLYLHGTKLSRLSQLKDELGLENVVLLAADFDDEVSLADFLSQIEEVTFDVVINNAGFGSHGTFLESDAKRNHDMMMTNVLALTQICHAVMVNMKKEQKGSILNVGSVASFFSGPMMSVYYATKAYVLSLSLSLYEEGKRDNIVVSCLCPGPTRTSFHERANIRKDSNFYRMFDDNPAIVAKKGINALERGKAIEVPKISNKFFVFASRLFPKTLFAKILYTVQKTR